VALVTCLPAGLGRLVRGARTAGEEEQQGGGSGQGQAGPHVAMLSRNHRSPYAVGVQDRRLDPSGDPGHDEVQPAWQPPRMPADQARLGLDRNTVEGAWIEFASALDRSKPVHRLVAWVLLVLLLVPVGLSLLDQVARLWPL
jgi:hypothetical protein